MSTCCVTIWPSGRRKLLPRHVADALMSLQLPTDTSVPLLVAVGERETRFAKQSARKIVETVPGAAWRHGAGRGSRLEFGEARAVRTHGAGVVRGQAVADGAESALNG